MLAADKLQLQSAVKQQATALKEKEFNLHHSNMMTVGTQAAVLAGLNTTMFIEFQPAHNTEWGQELLLVPRVLKFLYYITIVSAFCANILVVGQTALLSVTATSLALRGPDGSMMTATDGLYEERVSVFQTFGFGLGATVASVVISVWLMLHPETAAVCMGITIFTGLRMYRSYLRVTRKFDYNEDDTVDFTDIFNGPAAIKAIWKKNSKKSQELPHNTMNEALSWVQNCDVRKTKSTLKNSNQYSSHNKHQYSSDDEERYLDAYRIEKGKTSRRRRRDGNRYYNHQRNSDYEYDSGSGKNYTDRSNSPIHSEPERLQTV